MGKIIASILIFTCIISKTNFVSANHISDTIEVWRLLQKSEDYYQKNIDSVIEFIKPALKLSEELKFAKGIVESKRLMGKYYLINEDFNRATTFYLEAMETAEKNGNRIQIADLNLSLGRICEAMEDFQKSIVYYNKSLATYKELKDTLGIANALKCIGNIHHFREYCEKRTEVEKIEDFKKAIEFYEESNLYYAKINVNEGIADSYINIGTALNKLINPKKALEFVLKAERIYDSLQAKDALASTQFALGRIYKNLRQHKKSLKSFENSLKLASEVGRTGGIQYVYEAMAQAYDSLQEYKNAKDYYLKYMILRDSIYNAEKSQQIFDLETKYQSEKKEKEIALLNQEKNNSKAKLNRRRNLIYFISILALILIFTVIYVYRNFKLKKKLWMQLEEQNKEILDKNSELNAQKDQLETYNLQLENQKEEILAQRDVINKKNEELSKAFHQIEVKNNDITASIRYAKRIQNSNLPQTNYLHKLFPESFVHYQPKDIVSGDFYWFFENNKIKIVAVSDCTGHGVPGAFMSFVGINLLNQAVKEHQLQQANKILDFINTKLIETIHNANKTEIVRDGMEIGICVFNKEEGNLKYAGAGIDLIQISNNELKQIKADKHSIGYKFYDEFLQYSQNEIPYQTGDFFYMSSDGFEDQFGGEKKRKYGRKKFREFLLNIHTNNIESQKQIINKELKAWQGDQEQVDDILIVGLKA